jgi:pilus assembly protein CpaB
MKKPQIIAVSVAGGAALLAGYFATSFMPKPQAPIVQTQEVDSVPVLVAAADISVGQIVNEGNFRWISWPKEAASRGYITNENGAGDKRKRELAGSVARFALLNGEPITAQKLIKAGQGACLLQFRRAACARFDQIIEDRSRKPYSAERPCRRHS